MDSHAMLRLTETDGGGNSTELSTIKVSEATITIGRSNEADLCFGENDQSVSRHQFEVSFSGGVPTLKNTGRNPVVYKKGRKQLASGAQINIVSGLELTFSESKLRFDVEVPVVYCLKTKGAGGRATFEIESNRKYIVGRSPECDITLDSSGVSRRHCKMQIEPTEILKLHDLGSVNGVRLFLKGEVQEESSDIEVPCGVKFIIGDIECIWDKKGQGEKKKRILWPVVIVLLALVASIAYFVLKSGQDKPDGGGATGTPAETKTPGQVRAGELGVNDISEADNGSGQQPDTDPEEERRLQNIKKLRAIVQSNASFDKKADQLAVLAKEPDFKELKPVCEQLVEYYSLCSVVGKQIGFLSGTYEQRKRETRSSIKQMKFDFAPTLSFTELKKEKNKLEVLYKSVVVLLKEKEITLDSPRKLTVDAGELIEKVNIYGEKARGLSFIWTDLENSSFAASKFDKREVMASIETLYPGEGIGDEVCTQIDEIINYREQMSAAYQGLIGQISLVLSNYTECGVSKEFVPKRYVLEPLREAIRIPLPKYFEEPPPIAVVTSNLYNHIDAISNEWTNLEFLTYCGEWKSDLEKRKKVFARIDEVLPLMGKLCVEAASKCAADVDKGMDPYREIMGRQEAGEELGLNDARKLIQVYDLCYEYLQHDLFCELRKESKKEMEAVSADSLNRLYVQLKKECADGVMALDASEKGKCVQNAKKILEALDSAVCLPPDFKTKIEDYRKWVEDVEDGK